MLPAWCLTKRQTRCSGSQPASAQTSKTGSGRLTRNSSNLVIVENGRGTPISALHYFTSPFEEAQQEMSPQYWEYIERKVGTFERTWAGFNPRETKQ